MTPQPIIELKDRTRPILVWIDGLSVWAPVEWDKTCKVWRSIMSEDGYAIHPAKIEWWLEMPSRPAVL